MNGKQNSVTGPVITGSFEKRAPQNGSISFSTKLLTGRISECELKTKLRGKLINMTSVNK